MLLLSFHQRNSDDLLSRDVCCSQVVVPLPDMAGRRDILSVHLRNVPMESLREKDEACEQIAHITSGVFFRNELKMRAFHDFWKLTVQYIHVNIYAA